MYEAINVFHQSDRKLSEAERKTSRWAIIMTSAVTGNIIVPDLNLLPLHRISYVALAKEILIANPKKKLQKHEMDSLWNGIMSTIYDFEATLWDRKRHEVMVSIALGHSHLLRFACVHSLCRLSSTANFRKRQRS